MNPLYKAYCRSFQLVLRIALPALPYFEPQILNSTDEVPGLLERLGARSVLLVTDPGIERLGLIDSLVAALDRAGIACSVYTGTQANPTVENVEAALAQYQEHDCTAIIGFGGGSPMDCAKGVSARAAAPKKPLVKMRGLLKVHRVTPPIVAVPTTAGTGSEATLAAVITDAERHHKYVINDFALIPRYTVHDWRLTQGLPADVTAQTGMDALTHAVEAYIGRSTNRYTRACAEEAVALIHQNLLKAYREPGDATARSNMLKASYLAGCAFTRSYVGYVHGIAHSLGGKYGTPHGLANAVALPHVLRAYGTAAHYKLAKLARAVGIAVPSASDAQAAHAFIRWIDEMNEQLGIPRYLDGIRPEDVPEMAAYAAAESNPLYPVPVLMSARELEALYGIIGGWHRELVPAGASGTSAAQIERLVELQRAHFKTHATFDVAGRKAALTRLLHAVEAHEDDIAAALKTDLGKSHDEAYTCEIGLSLSEIRYQRDHVEGWSRTRLRATNLANSVARSTVTPVPYGVVLVMAPWNYPFLLTLEPLAGALAAGNTVVLKPSAYAPASSAVLRQICEECFNPELVAVVEGGRAQNAALLDQKWDYIFFTGGTKVGRLVMERASAHLTPVTLELGGKSPCIIEYSANLRVAAARVAFGKWLNVGQTCVAPDYVLVDRRVHDVFLELLEEEVVRMYGEDAFANPDYGKMINEKHYRRVCGLVEASAEKVVHGGRAKDATLQIEPTIMDGVTAEDAVMGEEIFGPVLPIIAYDTLDEAEAFITARPTPLALYIFTSRRDVEERLCRYVPFGGGCVNDTIIHLANPHVGFGGMGASGMGSYHGRKSFETFSHEKSIVKKYTFPDLPMRYQPYEPWKNKIIRLFLH